MQALKYKVVLRSGLCKVLSTKQYTEKRQQRCTDVIISVLAWKQHSAVPMSALFPFGSVVCFKSCRCDDHSVRRANETVDPTIVDLDFFSLPRTESKRTCRIRRFTLRLEPLRTITLTRQFGFFSVTFTFLAFAFGFVLCASQVDSFEVGCAYHVLYEASCIRVCSDTSCLVCVVFSPCLNVLPILTLALPLAASRGRRIYVIYVSIYLP